MGSNDDNNDIQRPNFFEGMVLTAADFQTLQKYTQNKHRRHNRCFQGSRVACGLEVKLRRNTVYLDPGMALDCQGNEIVLSKPAKISLPERERRFFLTIIYSEIKTNPVRLFPDDYDSSNEKFRRIKESFKLDWSARDPLSGHKWHNGAWVTCGGFHPIAIAKFVIRHGKVMLSKSFEEKISEGRQSW